MTTMPTPAARTRRQLFDAMAMVQDASSLTGSVGPNNHA